MNNFEQDSNIVEPGNLREHNLSSSQDQVMNTSELQVANETQSHVLGDCSPTKESQNFKIQKLEAELEAQNPRSVSNQQNYTVKVHEQMLLEDSQNIGVGNITHLNSNSTSNLQSHHQSHTKLQMSQHLTNKQLIEIGLQGQIPCEGNGTEFINIYPEKSEKTYLINLNQVKATNEDVKEDDSTHSDQQPASSLMNEQMHDEKVREYDDLNKQKKIKNTLSQQTSLNTDASQRQTALEHLNRQEPTIQSKSFMQPQNNFSKQADSTHSSQYFKDQEFSQQRISMDSKMRTVDEKQEGLFSVSKSQTLEQEMYSKEYDIFAWGLNDKHQLGQLSQNQEPSLKRSELSQVLYPKQIQDLQIKVRQIACAQSHNLILASTGQVYVLGDNSSGQLGLSVQNDPLVSFPVANSLQNVIKVVTSKNHSMVLTQDGRLLSSGLNGCGQLGLGNEFSSNFSNKIIQDEFNDVLILNGHVQGSEVLSQIFCSDNASGVLLHDEYMRLKIYIWGSFGFIESSDIGLQKIEIPVHVCDKTSLADIKSGNNSLIILTKSGKVFQSDKYMRFKHLENLKNVKEIATHGDQFAALDTMNHITTWRCQTVDELDRVQFTLIEQEPFAHQEHYDGMLQLSSLTVGNNFGHVIDQFGNFYGWGKNTYGELGTGDCVSKDKLTQIRVFNSQKQYMRCQRIFNGSNFSLGLFEVNVNPNFKITANQVSQSNPVSNKRPISKTYEIKDVGNMTHSHDFTSKGLPFMNQTYMMSKMPSNHINVTSDDMKILSSSRFAPNASKESSKERMTNQYEETQRALQKYKQHSQSYKVNVIEEKKFYFGKNFQDTHELERDSRINTHNYTEYSSRYARAQGSVRDNENYFIQDSKKREARSTSPYYSKTVQSNMKQIHEYPVPTEIHGYSNESAQAQNYQFGDQQLQAKSDFGSKFKNNKFNQETKGSNMYSFSQLDHQFDENAPKFSGYKNKMGSCVNQALANEFGQMEAQNLSKSANKVEAQALLGSLDAQNCYRNGKFQYAPDQFAPVQSFVIDKPVSRFALEKKIESELKHKPCQGQESDRFQKFGVNQILNYHAKDRKREEAPIRVSKFARSVTVAPPPRSTFSPELKNLTNPPTVTSIDATEAGELMKRAQEISQNKLSKSQPKYQNFIHSIDRNGVHLQQMIQKSINATSELLNRSQSRERKEGQSYRALRNINKQSSNRQYDRDSQIYNHEFAIQPKYNYGSKPVASDGSIDETGLSSINVNSFQKDMSRLHELPQVKGIAEEQQTQYQPYMNIQNQVHVMSNAETFAHIPGIRSTSLSGDVTLSKSTIDPTRGLSSNNFFNHGSDVRTSQVNTGREIVQKVNKYKRKLKKYIARNDDLQRQLKMEKQHNDHLSRQNDHLMSADRKNQDYGGMIMTQAQTLEAQLIDQKSGYEKLLIEKDKHITQLSSENIQMVNEIQDRDEKHQILEEKLEYVDKEVTSLGKQLLHANQENDKLKEELKKAHARDRIVHTLEEKLNQQNDNSIQLKKINSKLKESKFQIKAKDEVLKQAQEQINSVIQENKMTKKENGLLSQALEEFKMKVQALEQHNQILIKQMNQTSVQDAKRYQEQVNGLLSGKTTGFSQHSLLSRQNGPLSSHQFYGDNSVRTFSQNQSQIQQNNEEKINVKENDDLQNALSFQPSLQKLTHILSQQQQENEELTGTNQNSNSKLFSHQQFPMTNQMIHNEYQQQLPTFQQRDSQLERGSRSLSHREYSNRQSVHEEDMNGSSVKQSNSQEQLFVYQQMQASGQDVIQNFSQGTFVSSQMTSNTAQTPYNFGCDIKKESKVVSQDPKANATANKSINEPNHQMSTITYVNAPDNLQSQKQIGNDSLNLSRFKHQKLNEEYNDAINQSQVNPSDVSNIERSYSEYQREPMPLRGQNVLPAPFRSSSNGPSEAFGQSAQVKMPDMGPQIQGDQRQNKMNTITQVHGNSNGFTKNNSSIQGRSHSGNGERLGSDGFPNYDYVQKAYFNNLKNKLDPPSRSSIANTDDSFVKQAQNLTNQMQKQTFNAKSSQNSYSPLPGSADKNMSPMYGFHGYQKPAPFNHNDSHMNVQDQDQYNEPQPDAHQHKLQKDIEYAQQIEHLRERNHKSNSRSLGTGENFQGGQSAPLRDNSQGLKTHYEPRNAFGHNLTDAQLEHMENNNQLSQTQSIKPSKLTPRQNTSEETNEFAREIDKKTNYINSILNKFNKRTDDKIIKNMKNRDSQEGSQERRNNFAGEGQQKNTRHETKSADVLQTEKRSLQNTIEAERQTRNCNNVQLNEKTNDSEIFNPRRNFGELRSVDRLQRNRQKKDAEQEQVKNFREKSMEWYRRKARQGEQKRSLTPQDVQQTYQEAFKNLSHELKKKIDCEFKKDSSSYNVNTSYDDIKYHQSTNSKFDESQNFSQTYQSSQYKRAISRENLDARYLAAADTSDRQSRPDNYYSLFNNRDYPRDLPKQMRH